MFLVEKYHRLNILNITHEAVFPQKIPFEFVPKIVRNLLLLLIGFFLSYQTFLHFIGCEMVFLESRFVLYDFLNIFKKETLLYGPHANIRLFSCVNSSKNCTVKNWQTDKPLYATFQYNLTILNVINILGCYWTFCDSCGHVYLLWTFFDICWYTVCTILTAKK